MKLNNSFNLLRGLAAGVAIFILSGCGGGSGSAGNPNDSVNESTDVPLKEFNLVWSEEFNGNSLDASKWNIETGYGPNNSGWGNDESQLYTDSSDNLKIADGAAVITARCDSGNCVKRDGSITSAKINTKGKFELKYGKVEARIKLPSGRSTWPAFWMLGTGYPDVSWPQSGEIDIMEMHQQQSNVNTTHTTIHWFDESKATGSEWTFFTQNKQFDVPLTSDFHVYTLEWDEANIEGKIDGVTFYTKAINRTEMSEFHEPFYLILNIAIDGTLGGAPDAIKTIPQEMIVDWVHVYEDISAGGVTPTTPTTSSFNDGLLTSGDFENGVGVWIGNAANVTDELLGVDGTKANFANVATAGNPWDVNLSQVVAITQGTSYTLTFKAKSNGNRTMLAGIGLNQDPWTNNTESVSLTSEWQTFPLTLPATNFGGANSRVIFDMGADTGQVIIDEVSLVDGVNDEDGDGIVDAVDQCPNTLAGTPVDSAGCAIIIVPVEDEDGDGIVDAVDQCPNTLAGTPVDNVGCAIIIVPIEDEDGDGIVDAVDQCPGTPADTSVNSVGCPMNISAIIPLYTASTELEPVVSYVRGDGVVITRFGDRGRDRHAKDIGQYDPNNIFNSDHYDHYLAHYWEYRTARVQFEDYVPNGQSLIRATYITESQLSAKEFRVWFSGVTTTGQFHFNPTATYVGRGTWNDDFVKTSNTGHQFMYTIDITEQWKNVAIYNTPLRVGVNMEFEISQFLAAPPAGARKNYYGTSYVYVIGTPGMAPFEWDRYARDQLGSNDGTPIAPEGLLGGAGTLGYNYSEELAGRFMGMATNLSPGNAQPFVEGRRVHHTNFENGIHDERADNPVWTEQTGKLGNHYINTSCASCHVRNGRALVAEPGKELDKWVFKVGDSAGYPDPLIGRILQPEIAKIGTSEGSVTLGPWTELANGLRKPNYVFSVATPARFSARIAPQLVGLGLLDAVSEDTVMEWADPNDIDGTPGISGRVSLVDDPISGETRLGRFGYKASTFSVKHQVASAFNSDMGVMTSVLPTPDCGSAQTDCDTSGSELSDVHLDKLTKYIALLGVPARRDLNGSVALQGEEVFGSIGCAGCHRPSMQTSPNTPLTELRDQTIRPYTDLLLHDMGLGLADSLGEGLASGAEWRTTALWGLGHAVDVMVRDAKANDSVSMAGSADDINRVGFLHDGRARNIDEAIRWHGGEAQAAQSAYENLNASDKQALITFLESL